MNNVVFKKGDKVKCVQFLYGCDNKCKEMVGIFIRYNKYGDDISYVLYEQPFGEISCFTGGIELFIIKNQQLEFEFMYEE